MKIYVWRGPDLLADWANGMAVVIADTRAEAWSKLFRYDRRVHALLAERQRNPEEFSPHEAPPFVLFRG